MVLVHDHQVLVMVLAPGHPALVKVLAQDRHSSGPAAPPALAPASPPTARTITAAVMVLAAL